MLTFILLQFALEGVTGQFQTLFQGGANTLSVESAGSNDPNTLDMT
jgi:hypothetical protein